MKKEILLVVAAHMIELSKNVAHQIECEDYAHALITLGAVNEKLAVLQRCCEENMKQPA